MKTWNKWAGAMCAMLMSSSLAAPAAVPPKVGDKAPLIEGQDQDGKLWKLAEALGQKPVLLYFYPKDLTPGCTKQACGLRDRMPDLRAQGVEVVGVSFDSPESHRRFILQHKLNFTLLADPEGKIIEAYGARLPGKPMARRISFLIDKEGKIVHVTDHAAAEKHLDELKAALAKLKDK